MDTPTGHGKLLVADDPAALARMAADHLFTCTMEMSKPMRVALSGGSTPRRTYQELARHSPVPAARFEPSADLVFIADRAAAGNATGA